MRSEDDREVSHVMIEIHADDFGISPGASEQIIDCINNGCVNGTSIMPNSPYLSECMELLRRDCRKEVFLSVHFDLITGHALSGRSILTDGEGYFNVSYSGYILNLLLPFYRRKYLAAVKKELSAQLDRCLPYLDRERIRIDSHRHVHMIPAVFSIIMELIKEKNLRLSYIRITSDAPYAFRGIGHFTDFRPLNIIKSLLLFAFGTVNLFRFKKSLKGKTADFAGILFSGSLTPGNLRNILTNRLHRKAAKRGLEIMIHPYFITDGNEISAIHDTEDRAYVVSEMRRLEIEAVKSPGNIELLKKLS